MSIILVTAISEFLKVLVELNIIERYTFNIITHTLSLILL